MIKNFLQELRTQRWDDHRYYHHSRINQSLHFVSAASFLFAYVMLFFDPVVSALRRLAGLDDLAPGRSLLLRAAGLRPRQPCHPRAQGRDQGRLQSAAQGRADDDLGAVAAGARISIRRCSDCSRPGPRSADFMRQVAKIWLAVGIGGLLFRTVHLFFIRDVETGLVWMTKILTDPFNDLKLYSQGAAVPDEGRTDRSRPREARQARLSVSVMPHRSSCPALSRASTSWRTCGEENVDGRA